MMKRSRNYINGLSNIQMTMIGMCIFGVIQLGRAGWWNVRKVDNYMLEKLKRTYTAPATEHTQFGSRWTK